MKLHRKKGKLLVMPLLLSGLAIGNAFGEIIAIPAEDIPETSFKQLPPGRYLIPANQMPGPPGKAEAIRDEVASKGFRTVDPETVATFSLEHYRSSMVTIEEAEKKSSFPLSKIGQPGPFRTMKLQGAVLSRPKTYWRSLGPSRSTL